MNLAWKASYAGPGRRTIRSHAKPTVEQTDPQKSVRPRRDPRIPLAQALGQRDPDPLSRGPDPTVRSIPASARDRAPRAETSPRDRRAQPAGNDRQACLDKGRSRIDAESYHAATQEAARRTSRSPPEPAGLRGWLGQPLSPRRARLPRLLRWRRGRFRDRAGALQLGASRCGRSDRGSRRHPAPVTAGAVGAFGRAQPRRAPPASPA